MGITFSADEIFEMAEEIERNGGRFYRTAAGRAGDEDARSFLESLAHVEDEHLKTFAAMRKRAAAESTGSGLDPEGDAALYLQAIADGKVFDLKTDPSEMLSGEESLEEILATAIRLEKDSIVFYVGIREMVPENAGRGQVDAIIAEERHHITVLAEHLAALEE